VRSMGRKGRPCHLDVENQIPTFTITGLFYPCRAGSDDPLPLARSLRPYSSAILLGEADRDRCRPG
jgi:hypothetical protein